eukprot:6175656-Pyramimonas_sp.AAC.1
MSSSQHRTGSTASWGRQQTKHERSNTDGIPLVANKLSQLVQLLPLGPRDAHAIANAGLRHQPSPLGLA